MGKFCSLRLIRGVSGPSIGTIAERTTSRSRWAALRESLQIERAQGYYSLKGTPTHGRWSGWEISKGSARVEFKMEAKRGCRRLGTQQHGTINIFARLWIIFASTGNLGRVGRQGQGGGGQPLLTFKHKKCARNVNRGVVCVGGVRHGASVRQKASVFFVYGWVYSRNLHRQEEPSA